MRAEELIPAVAVGVVLGTLARLFMLRVDYRQYPSYPQGYVIHLSLGFIAALLGSIVVPSIATGDFAAASFLALAATQFREVRSVERETLTRLEAMELVPRGPAYIEGIARVFEARNYLAMVTALAATLAATVAHPWAGPTAAGCGVVAGVVTAILLQRSMEGRRIGDIARVRIGQIRFDGPLLTVDDVQIMNVGLPEARRRYLEEGIAVIIEPKDETAKEILANPGQRQAIAHEAAVRVGVERDVDQPEFTPLPRRSIRSGAVVFAIIPSIRDEAALLEAVRAVPVLEASVRRRLHPQAAKERARWRE